ncbi:MAG TPA: PASTA domain-containing protein [Draconibacterium sp.]|nr:PASTA domain-containing protein [Draconibacterium sp.]
MSLRQFLSSRIFLRQLVIAVILFAVLLFGIMKGLKIYTHHGESFSVPNFTGMKIGDVKQLASQKKFRIEVNDSVYVHDEAPGAVVDQVPEPGFKVKENRLIYLTINSISPEQVFVPKLTDISFRQAQVLIENCGLEIGQISYEPSEYNDLVLRVQIDSTDIETGQKLAKGTSIDLIIGRTQGNTTTPLPNLIGLPVLKAQSAITNAMLNPGVLIFDDSVINSEDSLNARVWRQRPDPKVSASVNLGTSIDLWLTVDSLKYNFITDDNLK